MIPSLEGWATKAKEAPSPHEFRLTPLDINPVFQFPLVTSVGFIIFGRQIKAHEILNVKVARLVNIKLDKIG